MLNIIKQIPRGIWITFFAIIGNSFGWSITAYLALFLKIHRGFSVTEIGAVMAGFGIGALIGAYTSGRLTDRYPPHQICLWALGVNALTLLILPALHNYLLLIVLTTIMGTANSAFSPANRVYIMKACPAPILKQVTNLRYTILNIGVGSGIFISTELAQLHALLPFFAGSLMLAVAAGFLKLEGTFNTADSATIQNNNQSTNNEAKNIRLLWIVLILTGLIQAIFSQIRSTLPLYLYQYYHVSQIDFGHLFLLNCILIILLQVPLSLLLARFSNYFIAALGSIAIGLGFGMLAFHGNYSFALFSTAIWTLGEMTFMPISQILVYELSPTDRKGWGMGMYQFIYALSAILGPAAGSLLLARGYPHVVWILSAFFGIVTAFFLSLIQKRNQISWLQKIA